MMAWWNNKKRGRAAAQRRRTLRHSPELLEERTLLALSPAILADINPGVPSSSPTEFTEVRGEAYFAADDGVRGRELWRTNPAAAGASLIADIRLGSTGSDPTDLVNAGGRLFFVADDGFTGRELWRSDGTAAGTVRVRDIRVGSTGSNPAELTVLFGTLFFTADDGFTGRELWRSDGTEAGTFRVKDIWGGVGGSNPSELTVMDELVFFTANDGFNGVELWRSDGTAGGTLMVVDIRPVSASSNPTGLVNANGVLYFAAEDGFTGRELWRSDGTVTGTLRVADIQPGSASSSPQNLTNWRGFVAFTAEDGFTGRELWRSDGTARGTFRVRDIRAGSLGSNPNWLTVAGANLFFAANDAFSGIELWKSDGTQTGTVLVRDIAVGSPSSSPAWLTTVKGLLVFAANDGFTGFEPWESDGTTAGTVRMADIRAGTGGSDPAGFALVQGRLFFAADDGFTGREPWKAETASLRSEVLLVGTDAGTIPQVRVLDPVTLVERYLVTPFFAPGFTGGVRLASGDVNGDGFPDVIVAPGAGAPPRVRVLDGASGNQITSGLGSFLAYTSGFTGGVFVAAADFDRDGRADIVTGADAGGGPHVRVFSGVDGRELASFFAFIPQFGGGVRVAAGDLDGNGVPDLVAAAGPGGGPHVRSFVGASSTQFPGALGSFYAYVPSFSGGVYVAAGDLNGDARADVVTGAGAGGGPHVRAFSGPGGAEMANFFAFTPSFGGGVRVATSDLDLNGRREIIAGAGPKGGPHVRAFDASGAERASFFAFPANFNGGLFVAGSARLASGSPLRAPEGTEARIEERPADGQCEPIAAADDIQAWEELQMGLLAPHSGNAAAGNVATLADVLLELTDDAAWELNALAVLQALDDELSSRAVGDGRSN